MAEFILLIILLFLAALTAASEISIIAASRIKLRKLARDGSKTAKMVLKILEIPERFFGTILVANDIVDALIAVLVTALVIQFIGKSGKWVIVFATVIASFLIIVSEVLSKTFAAQYSEKAALIFARPVRLLIRILSPIVKILEFINGVIVKLLGVRREGKPSLVTEEEIRALIKIWEEEKGAHKEKYKMLSKIFDFSETVVKDVMTPKKEMVAIDINTDFDDILNKALEAGYSRLPVYKDNPDNIVGIMNMKDLLIMASNRELVVLQDIIYTATFVSSSKKITEILKEFQKGHAHLAIITDAQGKIAGLVTLEDLLEEIVGEIEDEYDVRPLNYKNKKNAETK